jgi:DNA-binding MarR family transcriptional regulator
MTETSRAQANPLFLREEELRQGIELLFYAYRDFTSEPDAVLARLDFGRAHHRTVYFVGRYPGINVSGLLRILRITKQSLSRVLRQLIDEGYIEQQSGAKDRRQRLLTLTEKGRGLEHELTTRQARRMARAYREAGAVAVEGFRKVLLGILDDDNRRFVEGELGRDSPHAS